MSTDNVHIEATIKTSGHVKIINGDTVIEGHNKLTNAFMFSLSNIMSASKYYQSDTTGFNRGYSDTGWQWMYLGTDTTTQTGVGTTGLSNPIGSPTKCSTIDSQAWTSSNADYVQWIGVWSPGSISGTVGEMGLYLRLDDAWQSTFGHIMTTTTATLAARFSVADSEFSSFTIDETKPVVVVWTVKMETDGRFVNQGVNAVMNYVACNGHSGTTNLANSYFTAYNWTGKASYMVLGSNTDTVTTGGMTALVSPIGTSPGTKATSQDGTCTNPSTGSYQTTYLATWPAGTISGATCGEIGLYLNSPNGVNFTGLSQLTYGSTSYLLFIRLSAAQSDFTPFEINPENNLTVSVTVRFTWA